MKKQLLNLVLLNLLLFVGACSKESLKDSEPHLSTTIVNSKPNYLIDDDSNRLLGDPEEAQQSLLFPEKYLIDAQYYVESYNNTTHCPNWVSWHVDKTSLGATKRKDDFRASDQLPATWYPLNEASYRGSGFDRGHNCPSGDRTSSGEANSSTFLMTNMIPQSPKNNQKTWEQLEEYTRTLVKEGNEAYIIMGSYGCGGTGKNGYAEAISDGMAKIKVPSRIWKIVVVIPHGSNDLSRITTATRVIAIDTPNSETIDPDWKKYRTSVRALEVATGYKFLSNLPANVRDALQSKIDGV